MGTSPGTPPGLMSRSLHLKHTGRSPTLPPAQGSQGPPPPRASALGSSPLARGLPLSQPPRLSRQRIIPARAGFTPSRRGRAGLRPDHPRSRGVYLFPTPTPLSSLGSSPLARGLPYLSEKQGHYIRIIPARAGFTVRRVWWTRALWDHPRSRGVYHGCPSGRRT